MKGFIGKIFILIGGVLLVILALIGAGFLIYDFATGKLNVLTQTSFINGWIALLSFVFLILMNFILSLSSLRSISLNRSTKNHFFGSIVLLIMYILLHIYISVVIGYFKDVDLYSSTSIATYVGYAFLMVGNLFNYSI